MGRIYKTGMMIGNGKGHTWKNAALRRRVMEVVPLSITLNTSPVFLTLCHLTPNLCKWLNKLSRNSFVVNCCTLETTVIFANNINKFTSFDRHGECIIFHALIWEFLGHFYSPDPKDTLKACDKSTLSTDSTLKQGGQGINENRVIWEVWLLGCQPIDDCLVESWHKDIDSSQ